VESTRVIAPSGHSSREIDILIYDALDAIKLMSGPGGYAAYPAESVYGVIQVKSKLTKDEIHNGLTNIASYKKLKDSTGQSGFGILFAYDSDMEWGSIIKEVEAFAKSVPNTQWCNVIVILNQGIMMHGQGNMGTTVNSKLETITSLQMHGRPDTSGSSCLFSFYGTLMALLDERHVTPPDPSKYYRLPLVAGDHSYEFSFGVVGEVAGCEKHGSYQRRLDSDTIDKLLEAAKVSAPINFWKAIDIANGEAGDNEERYKKQPETVRIYNPDSLPLSEILVMGDKPGKPLAFDGIQCRGMCILIPYQYSKKEHIFEPCPKCKAELNRTQARKSKALSSGSPPAGGPPA